MKSPLFMVIFLISLSSEVLSQNGETQEIIKLNELEIESESERVDQVQENYQQFDALETYSKSPLKLNSLSEIELYAFPYFNETQVKNILDHRKKFGDFIAIEELQLVQGFDEELIRNLRPLLSVGALAGQRKIKGRGLIKEGTNTFMIRIQKNLDSEEDQSSWPGSNEKIYARYKYQFSDRIRIGFTAEKDPGEEFFSNSKSFDFYSGHLLYRSKSFLRQITIGDYSIQHGQGLVLWSGMGFGKSAEVINIKKNPGTIKPYTSIDENNFFRGICISTNFKNWQSDLFFSSHKKDANRISSDTIPIFSALQSSGYHRTEAEIEDRKSLNEIISGVTLNRSMGNLRIGAIIYLTQFSGILYKEPSISNQFEFSGRQNTNYGIHASYLYKNTNSFTEIGRSKSGGMAYLLGSMVHLHPKLSYSILLRKYDRNYQALQAAAFGENTKVSNEQGVFSGAQLKLPWNLLLSAYLDYYIFPWLNYSTNAPSSGFDYLILLKWKPKRNFESYIQFKSKIKQGNSSDNKDKLYHLENRIHSSIRWNIRIKLNETWDWGSRVEKSFYKKGDQDLQYGLLLYQDLIFHPLNFPVSVGLRYAVFDTEDYNTRIYAYENDVLFSYSIPAMQGKGERMYINIRYRISRALDLWLRYSISTFEKELPSSDTPTGQKVPKNDLKIQLRLQF
jgi:hypothetical protein